MIKKFSKGNLQDVSGGMILKRQAENYDRTQWPYCTQADEFLYDVQPDSLYDTFDFGHERPVFKDLESAVECANRYGYSTDVIDSTITKRDDVL